ncbi:venom protease-like [Anticarsia gemmatalis]|uniref:venom protease-like n=1 Tax=Anticarsia gemmatalis TaxID=129554 RepID=UPI003F774C4D
MTHSMLFVCLCVVFFAAARGQQEGEPCVEGYANTAGTCVPLEQCKSARDDFQKSGIRPTFCSHNTFGGSLVCCRDGSNILTNPFNTKNTDRPVWSTANKDGRRVSERKCEEYSRGVIEKVDYIPLIPEPETLSISAAKCDYTGVELIIGGENAQTGEFPHMAAIGWADFLGGYKFKCGGSVISPRYVLTAGHCTSDARDSTTRGAEPVVVRLGDQNIDNSVRDGANPIDVPIRNIIRHPEYRPPKVYNDIALLELATDVSFRNGIRAACLWNKRDFPGYEKVIATGWGVTDTRTRETSNELKKVSLSIFNNRECDKLLENEHSRKFHGVVETQMCAGELRGGVDTCQGDSGSPLQVASLDNQCIFHIAGITSVGKQCAQSGLPGVYTRVSAYLDWIEGQVWPGE